MPIGFDVISRARRTIAATSSGGRNDAPMTPRPPASDTRPTRSPPVYPPPIPAHTTAWSIPISSVNGVRITY